MYNKCVKTYTYVEPIVVDHLAISDMSELFFWFIQLERPCCQVALTAAPLISKPHWGVFGAFGKHVIYDWTSDWRSMTVKHFGWKAMIRLDENDSSQNTNRVFHRVFGVVPPSPAAWFKSMVTSESWSYLAEVA